MAKKAGGWDAFDGPRRVLIVCHSVERGRRKHRTPRGGLASAVKAVGWHALSMDAKGVRSRGGLSCLGVACPSGVFAIPCRQCESSIPKPVQG
jgi:hypothetical protein